MFSSEKGDSARNYDNLRYVLSFPVSALPSHLECAESSIAFTSKMIMHEVVIQLKDIRSITQNQSRFGLLNTITITTASRDEVRVRLCNALALLFVLYIDARFSIALA